MKLFNTHTHTNNSLDCQVSAEKMCQSAILKGLSGIAVCDHCHGSNYITYQTYDVLKSSHRDAQLMQEKFSGKLEVFKGAEFDEIIWGKDYINRLIESETFDIILASVHRVRNVSDTNYISRVKYNRLPEDILKDHILNYFYDILETARTADFDVLSHLTLILRYVSGKYKIKVDLDEFLPIIDQILKTLISREKALEFNTSEFENIGFMPNEEIIKRYRSFGGELITIGTDAHLPENMDYGFREAVNVLKSCGFNGYYYYKNRKPQKEYI